MLLLAHYGFLHPQTSDPFTCSGAAMSLALEMGLQHEIVADRGRLLSQKERDDRRILFWSTYIMNWYEPRRSSRTHIISSKADLS